LAVYMSEYFTDFSDTYEYVQHGSLMPDTESSDLLAKLLAASQSQENKDTSHSKCDAVGLFLFFSC
jgi:hypothetical protein